jgi:hypothetical protein
METYFIMLLVMACLVATAIGYLVLLPKET